jgi:hypothetical protein
MTCRREITCIEKTARPEFYERIVRVGGPSPDGPWIMSEAEAIGAILLGCDSFYVKTGNREIDVVIGSHDGRAYLKTAADQFVPRILLGLPDFSQVGLALSAVTSSCFCARYRGSHAHRSYHRGAAAATPWPQAEHRSILC